MSEIAYRWLTEKDKAQFLRLYNAMYEKLPRKDFFLPYSDEELDDIFQKNRTIVLGAFDGEKLIGTGAIFSDPNELSWIINAIKIPKEGVCELGGYMVDSRYFKQGIMTTLQSKLFEHLHGTKFKIAVATAHPENKPSISVLKKQFESVKVMIRPDEGVLREIFVRKLTPNVQGHHRGT